MPDPGAIVETVIVNGQDIVELPPPDRFLIIDPEGLPVTEVMWDGVTAFDPGDGHTLVRTSEWSGDPYAGPPETDDARVRRTRVERLDDLLVNLVADRDGFDGFTAAQRQAAQKRTLRAVILLIREYRGGNEVE